VARAESLDDLAFEPVPLRAHPWRVVEGQHVISTRKLVDSSEEQQLLEEMIEGVKPPLPDEPAFERLHYLLSTPFRYPPLRHGSRFGTRAERGIWYGAERRGTAFSEAAYYRLVFLEGTEAELEPIRVNLTIFRARVATESGVDLTDPPPRCGARAEAAISSPVSYETPQRVGARMRAAGIEAFRFRSARDPEGGANVGVLDPRAFAEDRPDGFETWYCVATPEVVEMFRRRSDRSNRWAVTVHRFPRETFEVEGRLPMPAL
jgi:hypothetical protein